MPGDLSHPTYKRVTLMQEVEMVRRGSAYYGGITPLDGHYVSRVEDREPKQQLIDGANEVPFLITSRELRDRKTEGERSVVPRGPPCAALADFGDRDGRRRSAAYAQHLVRGQSRGGEVVSQGRSTGKAQSGLYDKIFPGSACIGHLKEFEP